MDFDWRRANAAALGAAATYLARVHAMTKEFLRLAADEQSELPTR
ncbi:hypothetical protein [Aliidongia dinghuensis]|nr:hypothetical protein [Aliidongia dinghuensis]